MKLKFFVIFTVLLISASTLAGTTVYTTKSGYLASISEKMLDKAIDYSVAGDTAALQKLMDAKLVFVMKGGLRVYLEDLKMFAGKVKIRPVGETVEVWTVYEAINK